MLLSINPSQPAFDVAHVGKGVIVKWGETINVSDADAKKYLEINRHGLPLFVEGDYSTESELVVKADKAETDSEK